MIAIGAQLLHGRIALAHAIELRVVELKGFEIRETPIRLACMWLCGNGSLVGGRSVLTASTITQRVAVTRQNACVIGYVRQHLFEFFVRLLEAARHRED